MRVVLAIAVVAAPLLLASEVGAEEGRVEAIMNPIGGSLAQDPRVINVAAPMVELRGTRHLDPSRPWLAADSGLAMLILPEMVFEARVGARLYPWRATRAGELARALYLRPGAHALLALDGFDVGPDIEIGIAPTARRLTLLAGVSVSSYLVNPHVVAELRFGVGARF